MSKKIPLSFLSGKDKTITFHRFPHHIWHDHNYSLHERVILCRVWSFQNSNPPLRCYLSYDQWAKELAIHRVTAINLLNGMVKRGLLEKKRAPEGSNEWSLVVSDYHLGSNAESASSVALPSLVVSDYHPSSVALPSLVVSDYPRRSLEDQLEDQLGDHASAIATAPLSTTSLELGAIKDSLTAEEPPTEPLAILAEPERLTVSPTPQVSPPPLPKKKKAPSQKTGFPSSDFWTEATPRLIEWAIENGAEGSAVTQWVQEKIEDMRDSAAAKGYRFIDWVAAFRKWYRRELPKGLGPDADIRKATVWLWNHTHGERMEKPPASQVVVTAVRKTLEQLGKNYLTELGETEEKWREFKLKELRQMIRDNLEVVR